MEQNKLVDLITESDHSIYLFVKDGKVTMALSEDLSVDYLVEIFGYVTARILLNPSLDNMPPNMLQ